MKQIWKKINLYGKEYYVNDTGLIKNKYGRILKPYLSSGEYGYIKIVENGKHHHVRIHRIVADAFIPNINNLPQVNHKDGNKLNNCVNNLEWISASGNVKHGYTNNLYKRSRSRTTKVNQYDLNGTYIQSFPSARFSGK